MEIWSFNQREYCMWNKVQLAWHEHSQVAVSTHSCCHLSIVTNASFTNTSNPISGCPSGRQSSSMVVSASASARHGLLNAQLFRSCRRTSPPLLLTRDKSVCVCCFWFWNAERSLFLCYFEKITLWKQYLNYSTMAMGWHRSINFSKGNIKISGRIFFS